MKNFQNFNRCILIKKFRYNKDHLYYGGWHCEHKTVESIFVLKRILILNLFYAHNDSPNLRGRVTNESL